MDVMIFELVSGFGLGFCRLGIWILWFGAARIDFAPRFPPRHFGTKNMIFQRAHFTDFWASGLSAKSRPRDLESNALIGIEFCEFRQKLKDYESVSYTHLTLPTIE